MNELHFAHFKRIERRQEFGRIKTIEVDCEKKRVREEYQIMLDEQKKLEDAKTAKKREKRLSKKKVKDSNKKLKEKEPEQSDQKVDDDE